jgi:quercetin dioxygenase-like cupin family protein
LSQNRLLPDANRFPLFGFVPQERQTEGPTMPQVTGFSSIANAPEEHITDKISRRVISGDQCMIVWWTILKGAHAAAHSHANEQIFWMLSGQMEMRIGETRRTCGPGEIGVIPGGVEHEAWFHEDTQVIDVFAPPREDFLSGGPPAYMKED